MKATTENLLDWRSHEPLMKTRAQLAELETRLTDLQEKRAEAQARYDKGISELADLEARQVLGSATDGEVRAAHAEATTARNELAEVDAALTKESHARELLETEIPGLEAEGKATVKAAYHEAYKPAVRRLLDAVRAASEANGELETILRAAGVDFGDRYRVDLDAHLPSFLPDVIRTDLRLTPPGVHGPCELARWMDSVTEYCDGGDS